MISSRNPPLVLAVFLCLAFSSPMSPMSSGENQQDDAIRVEQGALSYEDVNADRLRFQVRIRLAIPWGNLTLSSMRFENLTANGFPLVVEPYQGRIDLEKNELVELPEPLRVSIYFREIRSLDPLRELLSQKSTTIRGTAHLTLRTRGALKIITLGRKLRRSLDLEQEVTMDLLDHPLARILADQMLRELSDPDSLLGTEWLEQQLQLQSLVRRGDGLRSGMVAVSSRFQLTEGIDKQVLGGGGVGFFVGRRLVVTTKKAIQPWKFDPEIAYSQREGFRLDPEGYDVVLDSPGGTPLSLTRGELELENVPPDDLREEDYEVSGSTVVVETHKIDSPRALTLLTLPRNRELEAPLPLEPAPERGRFLVGLAYFQNAGANEPPTLHTGWALATPQGDLLLLDRSFPEEASGAPVFDEEGRVRAIFMADDRCLPIQLLKGLGVEID